MRLLGGTTYWLQGCTYTDEVVIAMAHGVILKNKLAREWSTGVERHQSGLIEILVIQIAYCGRGCSAVAPKQIQRCLFRHARVLPGVLSIHLVDGIPGHSYRLTSGDRQCQLDLQRVDAGYMMDDDA